MVAQTLERAEGGKGNVKGLFKTMFYVIKTLLHWNTFCYIWAKVEGTVKRRRRRRRRT